MAERVRQYFVKQHNDPDTHWKKLEKFDIREAPTRKVFIIEDEIL